MKTRTKPSLVPLGEAPQDPSLPSADEIKHYVMQNASAFGRLKEGTFEFTTHAQAEHLSAMLALNTPFPEKASMGIWELLSNAIEHGNLGIDMELKAELLTKGKMLEEVESRHAQKPYADRVATAEFKVMKDRIVLRVTDEGEGFDFVSILEGEMPMDLPNGRGIKMANQVCFDEMQFSGTGNQVEAVFHLDE